ARGPNMLVPVGYSPISPTSSMKLPLRETHPRRTSKSARNALAASENCRSVPPVCRLSVIRKMGDERALFGASAHCCSSCATLRLAVVVIYLSRLTGRHGTLHEAT